MFGRFVAFVDSVYYLVRHEAFERGRDMLRRNLHGVQAVFIVCLVYYCFRNEVIYLLDEAIHFVFRDNDDFNDSLYILVVTLVFLDCKKEDEVRKGAKTCYLWFTLIRCLILRCYFTLGR